MYSILLCSHYSHFCSILFCEVIPNQLKSRNFLSGYLPELKYDNIKYLRTISCEYINETGENFYLCV